MKQSTKIVALLLAAFVVYITAKGELGQYIQLLV